MNNRSRNILSDVPDVPYTPSWPPPWLAECDAALPAGSAGSAQPPTQVRLRKDLPQLAEKHKPSDDGSLATSDHVPAEPATAVDYDKVERRLIKEPAYQTKKPRYALLLFGPEARLQVWVVLDGETLYVDRNGDGDLTGAGERFGKEADCKNVEIADPDGKTRYVINRVRSDYSHYTPKARREREAKGIPPGLLVEVSIRGPVAYRQYR
jgi:hypothetical protein